MHTIEQNGGQEVIELSDYEKERGKPRPNIIHGVIQAALLIQFSKEAADRFLVVPELTLELTSGSSLTPDLAVLPRRPLHGTREPARCRDIPLMVVEIVSPSQGYEVIVEKTDAYFAHGVQSVWEVNPGLHVVAIHRPGQEVPDIFQHGEAKDPATGLTVQVEEIPF